MLDTFQSFNVRDFRQRYQGSYGYYTVPESKKRVLVWMAEVGDNTVQFHDTQGAIYTAEADTGVEFEFIPVSKKLFVVNDRLYFIQRRPARQWSRGVNTQNTSAHQITDRGVSPTSLTYAIITAAFDTAPADVLQSVMALEQGSRSAVALSTTFGITGKTLYVYDTPIGKVDLFPTRAFVLNDKTFQQEIKDLVAAHLLPYEVRHG